MVNVDAFERPRWKADAFFRWYGGKDAQKSLADVLPSLQMLNPDLKLHLATDAASEDLWRLGYGQKERLEFLCFDDVRAQDVVEIRMPSPISDEMMAGLAESSKDWLWLELSVGGRQLGPHRFERTANGDLLIRPASYHQRREVHRCSQAFWEIVRAEKRFDMIGLFERDWGIFHGSGHGELWEVDFACLPASVSEARVAGRRHTQQEFWETTPIGTITYVDRLDLPVEIHIGRAQAILATGSKFAIVADLEHLEYRVYRASGLTIEREDFRLPEMPWFEIPKIQ